MLFLDEVTDIFQELPSATTAVIMFGATMVKDAAATPPKKTPFTKLRFAPVIVMVVPDVPTTGENPVNHTESVNVKPDKELDP